MCNYIHILSSSNLRELKYNSIFLPTPCTSVLCRHCTVVCDGFVIRAVAGFPLSLLPAPLSRQGHQPHS